MLLLQMSERQIGRSCIGAGQLALPYFVRFSSAFKCLPSEVHSCISQSWCAFLSRNVQSRPDISIRSVAHRGTHLAKYAVIIHRVSTLYRTRPQLFLKVILEVNAQFWRVHDHYKWCTIISSIKWISSHTRMTFWGLTFSLSE
jgi:hypothetical protein